MSIPPPDFKDLPPIIPTPPFAPKETNYALIWAGKHLGGRMYLTITPPVPNTIFIVIQFPGDTEDDYVGMATLPPEILADRNVIVETVMREIEKSYSLCEYDRMKDLLAAKEIRVQ